MDIKIIFEAKDGDVVGQIHHAKNVTILSDGVVCDKIIVENTDGTYNKYNLSSSQEMIRIESMNT